MAQMFQRSWLKCYYTIAVIKLTRATSHFPLETQPRGRLIACSPALPKSRYLPVDQTTVTPIVTSYRR